MAYNERTQPKGIAMSKPLSRKFRRLVRKTNRYNRKTQRLTAKLERKLNSITK